MKKLVSILLTTSLLLTGITGCASSNNTSKTPSQNSATTSTAVATATAASTTVAKTSDSPTHTITWMTNRSSWDAMKLVANNYMKENPNVKVEFQIISDPSSYSQKLKILASSNSLPNLFDSEADSTLAEIAKKGDVLDIDKLYADLGYTDKMKKIGTSYPRMADGKLYSLAWEDNIEYFFYHKDLFKKAGITTPPNTFDEFLADCQKLKDAKITPISTWPGWEDLRWLSFVPYRLEGNKYIEDLSTGKAKMSDPIGVQAATFYQKLAQNYFEDGWATSDYTNALQSFLGGHAAIYYIGTWQFSSFTDKSGELKDDYAYFKLPTVKGAVTDDNSMYSNSGTGTCVNAKTYDDTVKGFLKYVLKNYPDIAFNKFGIVPPMDFKVDGKVSNFNQSVLDDTNKLSGYAKTWDVTLNGDAVDNIYKEIVNLGMGQIKPAEFTKRVDSFISDSINK